MILTGIFRTLSILFWALVIIGFLVIPTRILHLFEEKTLNIFTWSHVLDPAYIRKFQQDTGIKVNVSYFESNEELLGKLGLKDSGYDLIVPSDYAVAWMVKKDLLKPIDRKRLTFFDRIDSRLLGNYFDPDNRYSLPYFWGVYSVIINKNYYQGAYPHDLKLIFDKTYVPHFVCMPSNARELIMLASIYLFGSIGSLLDEHKREQVKQLLLEQKKWVSNYSDERVEYLIGSRTCGAALALSTDYQRIEKENKHVDLIIPQDGAVAVIDSFVIAKTSKKDELIYQFLNYMYRDESVIHHAKTFGVCPPTIGSNFQSSSTVCKRLEEIKSFTFFDAQNIPDAIFNDIWIALMAA